MYDNVSLIPPKFDLMKVLSYQDLYGAVAELNVVLRQRKNQYYVVLK